MSTLYRRQLAALRARWQRSRWWRASQLFRARGGSVHAAAIASAALLALGPFLLAFATFSGYLLRGTVRPELVLEYLLAEVPQAAPLEPELRRILTRQAAAASGPRALASVLLSLWSASVLGTALRAGMRAVAAPGQRSSLVRERLYGLGTTLGAILLAVFWLLVGGVVGGLSVALPGPLRLASGLASSFALFLLVYRFLLPERLPFRALAQGALTGAVAWEAAKLAIVAATRWFGSGSEVYGLLGAVTGVLLAANLAAIVTLYGAAVIATANSDTFSTPEHPA